MNISSTMLAVMLLGVTSLSGAEPDVLPEPGPANQGLRMRLLVAPRSDAEEGFEVRIDLVNTSKEPVTLVAGWTRDDTGGLPDYLDAATNIECVPEVRRWIGGVMATQRQSPQPQQVLPAGETLTVRWQTPGRFLKNRVTNPNDVQNPTFPVDGLYAVHATLEVITPEVTLLLRSNEQLVSVGGSVAIPRPTLGRLLYINEEEQTARMSLGRLQQVQPGDVFEYFSKREQGRLTITSVAPNHSFGKLEVLHSLDGTLPKAGTEVSLPVPLADAE